MSAKKKTAPKKKPVAASVKSKQAAKGKFESRRDWRTVLGLPVTRLVAWRKSLQPASPHRSFRRTYRRDYIRPLNLPGYTAFTFFVWRTIWKYRVTFGWLVAVYALSSAFLVGLASQTTYLQLTELLRSGEGEAVIGSDLGQLGEAGLLLLTGISGGLNPNLGEAQQLISGLLALLVWLTTVWLLRAFLSGHRPRVRDGIYNSGAPLVPTLLLGMLLILQLVPAAIAAIGISAAIPTGLISQGAEAMLFWVVVMLLVLLSLYWVASTLLALVVVTLPGMYPLRALKAAHELVVGRRLPVVLRMVWLLFVTLFLWIVVMLPVIIFDAWLKGAWPAVEWLPIVPLVLLIMSTSSVVWAASYIYLFYRKVVDDDTAPA